MRNMGRKVTMVCMIGNSDRTHKTSQLRPC